MLRGGDGTLTNELLAGVLQAVQSGNWQRGGGKGPRPKRLRLNGEQDPDQKQIGTALSIEEMRQVLDNWSEGATEVDQEVVR